MDEYIGVVKMFAGNFAPKGWAFCQGQILPIAQYTAVFSLLGTVYGGNGSTTFALPNLGGRVPVGTGQSPGAGNCANGQIGGAESVTLLQTEMPAHNHQVMANSNAGTTNNPEGKVPAAAQFQEERDKPIIAVNAYADNSSGSIMNSQTLAPAGGNQPHNNMQPYLGMNYIICLEGIYPPRP